MAGEGVGAGTGTGTAGIMVAVRRKVWVGSSESLHLKFAPRMHSRT